MAKALAGHCAGAGFLKQVFGGSILLLTWAPCSALGYTASVKALCSGVSGVSYRIGTNYTACIYTP